MAGVFLPLRDEIFPYREHFGRVFYNNARISAGGTMAAIMGSPVAGGISLPTRSDESHMLEAPARSSSPAPTSSRQRPAKLTMATPAQQPEPLELILLKPNMGNAQRGRLPKKSLEPATANLNAMNALGENLLYEFTFSYGYAAGLLLRTTSTARSVEVRTRRRWKRPRDDPRVRLGHALLDVLREVGGVKSVKDGCAPQGYCGCCAILMDGRPTLSCLRRPEQGEGREITTMEGIGGEERRVLNEAFVKDGAIQCGYCIPGIVTRSVSLLRQGKKDREEIDGP